MTSLTFYGSVNEIDGNKILLEDKDTKVFLYFGKDHIDSQKTRKYANWPLKIEKNDRDTMFEITPLWRFQINTITC